MAGETALKFWRKKKVGVLDGVAVIQKEASIQMRSFDTKIHDFYEQFRHLNNKIEGLERKIDELQRAKES